MQCGENVENDPQTSSSSVCADNKKDTKAENSNMKKQLGCTENGTAVNTNWQEEINRLKAEHTAFVLNLQCDHGVGMRNLKTYYETKISELQFNHEMMFNDFKRNHESSVYHLRSLNYNQGIHYEAALSSMRALRDQMRKDHAQEVQCMRLQYDDLVREHEIEINGLVEENKVLCSEHESVLRNLHETIQNFKGNMKSSMIMTESAAMIKRLRNMYINSSLELSSTYPKQNGTEVEGLQVAEDATITAAHLQTTDCHEDSDADTTTSTIADDDADTTTSTIADDNADMIKSQDTMAQKLSLLHGYVFCKESNCLTRADDLQQLLDDFEEDAYSPQNSHDNSIDKYQDSEDENYAVAVVVKLLPNTK